MPLDKNQINDTTKNNKIIMNIFYNKKRLWLFRYIEKELFIKNFKEKS